MNFFSPKEESKEEKILTVSQITDHIKSRLESDEVLNNVWVEGEISNFHHHTSGHMYFSLKDEVSILRCAMFRAKNASLDFKPEDGIKVNVLGSIDVYKERGAYSLIIEQMFPAGRGSLFLKFQKLKKKLEKEGLFEERHKKPLPEFPQKIGIAASESGKAVRDIIKTIKKRFHDVTIILSHTIVQGEGAAESIVNSVHILNKYPGIDVIIISRGGGSFEDLWPFNEEIVARAIFESRVPIISAVGHEPDVSISDYVADKCAATPTAAGQLVVPDKDELLQYLENVKYTAITSVTRRTKNKRTELTSMLSSRVFRKPYDRINNCIQILDDKMNMVDITFSHRVQNFRNVLTGIEGKLIALNPRAVLERGYSIVMKGEKVVKDSKETRISDTLDVTLHKGGLSCKVEKIKNGGD